MFHPKTYCTPQHAQRSFSLIQLKSQPGSQEVLYLSRIDDPSTGNAPEFDLWIEELDCSTRLTAQPLVDVQE
jgi:hypothetical protein